LVVLEPEGAALAAAKILALSDAALAERIAAYQAEMMRSVEAADRSLNP
jgi:phosphoribosylcarboxyaminoimidazole (NCAIR) mutase